MQHTNKFQFINFRMSLPQEVVFESKVDIQARTDVGKYRAHNEDNFIVCPDLSKKQWCLSDQPEPLSSSGCLLVVADGMGGTNAGEIASEIAIETIRNTFNSLDIPEKLEDSMMREHLSKAVMDAHNAIVAASSQNPAHAGMGTTVVVAWVLQHTAVVAWVGDSRAYLHKKNKGLKLLTDDHSLVWEMVKAGRLTPDEADVHPNSNIITQSLGNGDRAPEPEFISCNMEQGDRLLLCSDGLNNMIPHKAIEIIMGDGSGLASVCQKLIDAANDEGGVDNITVVSLEVLEEPAKKNLFNLFGLL